MRVLIAIPHYHHAGTKPAGYDRPHGSIAADPRPRVAALTGAITALHQLYGTAQHIVPHSSRVAPPANTSLVTALTIIVCTTGGRHLLKALPLPVGSFEHLATEAPPLLLGFECHAVLRQRLGAHDFYGYLEDDLIARDPWMFRKLDWFNRQAGDEALLQPNRHEVGPLGLVHKAYIDGDLPVSSTSSFQNLSDRPVLSARVLDTPLLFHRARNPHAGCFFLNAIQMARWAARPDFLDRDTSFVGPLESAATLGIMRTFRIYKPAPESTSFLEIEHFGTAYLSQLQRCGAE